MMRRYKFNDAVLPDSLNHGYLNIADTNQKALDPYSFKDESKNACISMRTLTLCNAHPSSLLYHIVPSCTKFALKLPFQKKNFQ